MVNFAVYLSISTNVLFMLAKFVGHLDLSCNRRAKANLNLLTALELVFTIFWPFGLSFEKAAISHILYLNFRSLGTKISPQFISSKILS